MNVTRRNYSLAGMGCSNCGGEDDCFGMSQTPGFQVANATALQAGASPMGGSVNNNMDPAQWQWTPASSPTLLVGPMPPAGGPTANGFIDNWAAGGYSPSLNNFVGTPANPNGSGSVATPGSVASTLAQASSDYPTPTALTIAQAFQGANPGDAQPGYVSMPNLNWTANNLSFVKPLPGPSDTCPIANWANTNPLLLLAGAFVVAFIASLPASRQRALA